MKRLLGQLSNTISGMFTNLQFLKVKIHVFLLVLEEMNADLQVDFIVQEVKDAIFDMAPLQSLGPDGYGAIFYQTYWEEIGDKVLRQRWNF